MKKLRVGILFGGRSGEHEISLLSAASVFKGLLEGLGGGWVGGLAAHVDVLGDGDFGLS